MRSGIADSQADQRASPAFTGHRICVRPGDATAHANRALALARRAAQLERERWTDQALEVWESTVDACSAALMLDATLPEARNNRAVARGERARILDRLGRTAEAAEERAAALAELDQAILFEPRCAVSWLNRGILRSAPAASADPSRAGDAARDPLHAAGDALHAARGDLARALELSSDARLRSRVEEAIASIDRE